MFLVKGVSVIFQILEVEKTCGCSQSEMFQSAKPGLASCGILDQVMIPESKLSTVFWKLLTATPTEVFFLGIGDRVYIFFNGLACL